MNQETKTCQNCENRFDITQEDLSFYKKMDVPAPILCPECRQQLRILYRNFKTLYKRDSDKSGKSMISVYSDKAFFPVYTSEEWWEDDWSALDYGIDYDPFKGFFEQFVKLRDSVPHYGLMNTKSVDCEYSNLTFESKNCYLVFGCVNDENCAYGHITWNSKDCFDTLYVFKSELCYECTDSLNSNKLLYSQECESCADSIGLFDCRGCSNCVGCVGLRQKSYHVFNEPVGKEGYEKFLREHPIHDPRTINLVLKKRDELRKTLPQRHFFGSKNTDVSGNHIYNSRNVHNSFDVKGGENSKFAYTLRKVINTYDASFSPDLENSYECLAGQGMSMFFSRNCVNCSNVYYSEDCFSSNDIFGCVGLKSSEHCILNKKYEKPEYEKLISVIKENMKKSGEWGRFLSAKYSPFAYNESIVNEYMPLTKEGALEKGFRWEDDIPSTTDQETIEYEELPQNPDEYRIDLLSKEILKCEVCHRNYRFIGQEINFYKKLGLSLPKYCFNCRHQRRMNSRTMRQLFYATCSRCEKKIKTSYSGTEQEKFKIYCEQCYNAEVV